MIPLRVNYTVRVVQSAGRGQDRAAVFPLHGGGVLCALADGAGGTGSGGEAADQIIRIAELLSRNHFTSLQAALDAAEESIAVLGAGTTAVLLRIRDGVIDGISAGDSCAGLFGDGLDAELTHHQVRKPLVGQGAWGTVFGPVPLQGCLLIASDGLTKYVPMQTIRTILGSGSLEDRSVALIQAARLRSGALADDVAIILAEAMR